jgi:hypothetical protein
MTSAYACCLLPTAYCLLPTAYCPPILFPSSVGGYTSVRAWNSSEEGGAGREVQPVEISAPGNSFALVPRRREITIALLTLAYLVTRVGGLSRELVSEEGLFMMPGRLLFQGHGFDLYHKPALTSLLLGAFSFVGHDPIAGGRLVPFLTGLFICLLPFVLTDSAVPSILVLLSPFFLGAAAHMQTDSTVGLLGYGLVSAAIFLWYRTGGARGGAALVAGLVVLWLGKLEIAVIASTVLVLIILLLHPPGRARLARLSVIATVVGVISFVLMTWTLGWTAGLGFSQSVGGVVGTVTRISGDLMPQGAATGVGRRLLLFNFLRAFQVDALFALVVFPVILVLLLLPDRRLLPGGLTGSLLLAGLLPVAVYFAGGYVGDGFPRYFLIVFPPLLILHGYAMRLLSAIQYRGLAVGIVILACVLLLPDMAALWGSPFSVNVDKGRGGYRPAAGLVAFFTQPGDLILAPEAATYYIPNRRWLIQEEFLPYPGKHAAARARADELRAAIVPRLPAGPSRYGSPLGELVRAIDRKGSKSFYYGSLEVVVVCPKDCRPGGGVPSGGTPETPREVIH